ncbi:MAG: hypothetical protein HY234_16200 [Acidobacteria bacterium]|nr:hypothetical protein [Acidobacteriota bacterium]MBI3664579.1 hypothetical protein [Acidobacteriota bacterium]
MRDTKKAVWYGFLLWLIPFCVAVALFRVRTDNRPLFDSIMPVVLTVCVMWLLNLYFQAATGNVVREALLLGGLWLLMSLALDYPMFSYGPMKMSLAEYASDIGVAYLLIPAATIGAGFLLRRRTA